MSPLRAISITIALMALAACQKQGTAPATDAEPGTNNAGANTNTNKPIPDRGQFRIVSVRLGNAVDAEHRVEKEQNVFASQDTLYAAVLSTGKHQRLKLSAQWTGPNAAPIASNEQTLVPTSPTVTTFSVRNPNGWPVGSYQVVIAIDGQAMEAKRFEVR